MIVKYICFLDHSYPSINNKRKLRVIQQTLIITKGKKRERERKILSLIMKHLNSLREFTVPS